MSVPTAVPGILSRPARPELLTRWLADALMAEDPIGDWVRGITPEELESMDRRLVELVVRYLSARNHLHADVNRRLDAFAPAGRSEDR